MAASRLGFDALARTTLLRALQMRYGHSTRRARVGRARRVSEPVRQKRDS